MFDAAFDVVRSHVAAERLPTAVLGVADASGVLAVEGFGVASDARYRLFSITKLLTGISTMRAIERGLLTFQTPLTDAVPSFGAGRDDVVWLWHLASHTSGISEPALDTVVPLREELVSRGRDFAAGSVSRYSTLAFEGIAALFEHATGTTWDADVATWAQQLGASGLSLDASDVVEVVDAAVAGLSLDAFAATRSAGAGLVGRAEDLLAIGSELLRIGAGSPSTVLTQAGLRAMLRPLTGDIPRLEPYPAERGQDWGFTANLRSRAPGLIDRDCFGHAGWAGTEFWVHPSAGLCWVLMTNRAQRVGVDPDAIDNAIIGGR